MHALITGAQGFVGRALVARLLEHRRLAGRHVTTLSLLDLHLSAPTDPQPGVRLIEGSLAEADTVAQAFGPPVDVVFHLASIPGGTAERNYELARDVNLLGSLALLEHCRAQAETGGPVPVFVFASTIGVYGPLHGPVDERTMPDPQLSYGAQKLIGEVLVADFSRRGWVDGRSLRLPGVLARPSEPTGQLSAFMSNLIHEVGAGRSFTCPTSPGAVIWASSIRNVVDNLLHAVSADVAPLGGPRTAILPTQVFSLKALADAVGRVRGTAGAALVQWVPDERIESLFGRYPPLATPNALAAGFRADADVDQLVRDSVAT